MPQDFVVLRYISSPFLTTNVRVAGFAIEIVYYSQILRPSYYILKIPHSRLLGIMLGYNIHEMQDAAQHAKANPKENPPSIH